MPDPLVPAHLEYTSHGVPWSPVFGDVFHARVGALNQAHTVFLLGSRLPDRWRGQAQFAILETGFGLGHNFLATWESWRADPQACQRLHFISLEKHPFRASDLAIAHARAGVPPELSQALCAQWPMLVPGCHRIELDGGRVVLTLVFGDAPAQLPGLDAQADAIYLDGFAPDRNPDMWSAPVFKALAKLAAPGCTLATWSVSGAVRRGLAEAGFIVEKAPGSGDKRQVLRGQMPGPRIEVAKPHLRDAVVIGAGLAGCGIAERLAARAWRVTLIDAADGIAQGASGNRAGAFRPLPSADDNYLARLSRAGFVFALAHLYRLQEAGHRPRWAQCGVLHLARNARNGEKQRAAIAALDLPTAFVRWVDAAEATELAGAHCEHGGWWFPAGGWIEPASLCAANLAMAGERVLTRFNTRVERLHFADGEWNLFNAEEQLIARTTTLILANAHDARRLLGSEWLSLYSARGQVSYLPGQQVAPLKTVVCGQGYVTPVIDGEVTLGATFVVDDHSAEVRVAEHAENLEKLESMLPGYGADLDAESLAGRVSRRPITSDRMPIVGAIEGPGGGNAFLLSGFGARGLVWGGLCAELLASQICGETLPLERDLVRAMAPERSRPGP